MSVLLKCVLTCASTNSICCAREPSESSLFKCSFRHWQWAWLRWMFTFMTLKLPIQGHPKSILFADSQSTISTSQCFIVTIYISRTVKTIWAIFTFVTLKWPLKVHQGQRSRCTYINWAKMNIFVYRHPGPRSNRLDDTGHFHFRDLEMTASRSSEVNFFCGFWKADIDFPIVFHSNHMLISHHEEVIGDFHIHDLEMTPEGQSRSKVKMHFY